MAYRTRSNTQKLQRLIEFLKERECDSAANLEASAEVFLNDVKPKYKPGEIPIYDGNESDAGSSYVEEDDNKEEEWGSDWEEEWEEVPAPEHKSPSPSVMIPPKASTPPPPPPPPKEKTPPPPPQPKAQPSKAPVEPQPPMQRKESLTFCKKSFLKPEGSYKPAVVLSGVEKSSDVASPLMKFPTLPVSIPNFFGSNSGTPNVSLVSNQPKKKDKKKSQVPEDAVESVLVDSMTVVTAVAVPIDPAIAQLSKNGAKNEEETQPVAPPRRNSKDNLGAKSSVGKSSPVRIRKLSRQPEVDLTSEEDSMSSSFEKVEKSPLRSILKKCTPHSSSTDISETLPLDVQVVAKKALTAPVLSCSPSKVSFAEPMVTEMAKEWHIKGQEKSYAQVTEIPHCNPQEYHEIIVTVEGPLEVPKAKPPPEEEIKPKSKLSALMESESPKTKAKKHVTLQVPEPETSSKPKQKIPSSPMPGKKRPEVKPQPQLQYKVPDSAKIPKVGGQRSRKPTLASQWRMQKEQKKMEEQGLLDRIDTFSEDWPYSDTDETVPKVSTLAEAGFFFMGLNDCVQCSSCEIVLSGWNIMPDNDPWIQHAKTGPGCAFLEKTKGEDWLKEINK